MIEIEARDLSDYTLLLCKGAATLVNLKGVVDEIGRGRFHSDSHRKFLIDLRPLAGTIGTIERYELGKYMAEKIPLNKIAAISKPETYNKIGETVAVNRGANVLATDNEPSARDWLLA